MTKQPSYRFADYTESWKQRKLSEVTDYKNGKGYEDRQSDFGSYELINLNSISIDGGLKRSGKFIDKADETLEKGDLVMILSDVGHGNLLGRVAIIPESNKFVLNQRVALLRPRLNSNSQFLYSYINSNQYYFKSQGAGMSQLNISKSSVENFSSYLPSLPEQTAIGSFFQDIDQLISLQQRKLEVLKEQKKTYLKLLFPAKGQTKPAFRFTGFEGDWKEVKVSDIFRVTRGQVLATTEISAEKTDTHKYPVYSSQTKNEGLLGYYDKYLFETAITWTTDGANAGTVNYREGKFYSTNVNGVLLSAEGFANKVVAEILNNEAWKYVSKVGNPKLMNNVMSEISLVIPNDFREISILSTFFQDLDKAIAKQEEKVNQLKESKQTLLRKMFI
jgi:restriction modification system DNA specificity domain protein